MSAEHSPSEPARSTIVSRSPGLAYERMREARRSHFSQPVVRKLRVQGWLLAVLASTLAVLIAGPAALPGGPTVDLALLGAAAGSLLAASITAHVGVGLYRLRREPLTEREALALLAVEDGASYLGLGSGGLLVAATVVFAGALAVTGPVQATGVAVTTTAAVGAGAAVAGVVALVAGRRLRGRLPRTD